MAWPFTPLTTYISESLPTIKAVDLNAFQSAINRIYSGTRSLKALTLDPDGDNTVSPTPGVAYLNGGENDSDPIIHTTFNPTTRKLMWDVPTVGVGDVVTRMYYDVSGAFGPSFIVTTNAEWLDGTSKWARDDASDSSLTVTGLDMSFYAYASGSSDNWDDADWGINTPGSPDWVAGRLGITSRTDVEAVGILKGKRLYSTGTALTATGGVAPTFGDFLLSGTWGDTATAGSVGGDDTNGTVTVTCGGAMIGANPTVTLTFKDGTFTTAPTPMVALAQANDADLLLPLKWTASATQLTITLVGTPTTAHTYSFVWHNIGY